ncbi:MAG: hypothetical protein L6R35_002476 [Caloplaca aegaea]|nr:MAG: hypothetical protein L6R35_002476 [Caloplaca aegaea]
MATVSDQPGLLQAGSFWTGIFAIPLAVVMFFYLLRHWGWWKLHRQGDRRPLIRTWHGWVESKDEGSKRERNRLRRPPPRVPPRTARTDYSWVFWDPTGEKQRRFRQERRESFLRYLPRWMRGSPFGAAAPNTDVGHDIEAARLSEVLPESDSASASEGSRTLRLLGRHWRQGWRKVKSGATSSHGYESDPKHCSERPSTCTSAAHEGSSDDAISTIRLRKTGRQAWLGWQRGSEDIERARKTQLLVPTAGFNLASLFRRSSEQKDMDVERQDMPEKSVALTQQMSPASSSRSSRSPSLRHDTVFRQPRNITVIGPPHHLLRRIQSRRDLNRAFDGNFNRVRASCPLPERTQIDDHGVDDRSFRSRSPPPTDRDGGSPTQDYTLGWSIHNPRRRGRMRSTGESTAEAERMSMIEMPRVPGMGVSEYYYRTDEVDDDLGDVGDEVNICSPGNSRFGSLL